MVDPRRFVRQFGPASTRTSGPIYFADNSTPTGRAIVLGGLPRRVARARRARYYHRGSDVIRLGQRRAAAACKRSGSPRNRNYFARPSGAARRSASPAEIGGRLYHPHPVRRFPRHGLGGLDSGPPEPFLF